MDIKRELKVAYLAGVLDSDGWFTIHRNSNLPPSGESRVNPCYSPRVGVNQCERQAVELAQELYGGKILVIDYSKTANRFSQKPMWNWCCNSDTREAMLEELIPHLRIKVKQAKVLLRLVKDIRVNFHGGRHNSHSIEVIEFREKLYQELRLLNHPSVAETECVDSSNGDATVQTAQMENVQNEAEMTSSVSR